MAMLSVEFSVLLVVVTVTLMTSAAIGCTDRHVWIADGSYSCKGLLDPADTIGLYKKKDYFCNTYKLTYCCQTCKLVNEELRKQEQNVQEIKKPIVAADQLPNVIESPNSYLTSKPENIFQRWFSTLYQYFHELGKSNSLQNQV